MCSMCNFSYCLFPIPKQTNRFILKKKKKKGIFCSLFLGKLDVFVVCSADAKLSGVPADEHKDTVEMFSLHQKSQ